MHAVQMRPDFGRLELPWTHVIKRGGSRQPFSVTKIRRAIEGAIGDIHGRDTDLEDDARVLRDDLLEAITRVALTVLDMRFADRRDEEPAAECVLRVEDVEDAVASALRALGQGKVAEAYEDWQKKRSVIRDARAPAMPTSALKDHIHFTKYARWRKDLGRRETREETVDRMMDMHLAHFPQLSSDIERIRGRIKKGDILGSMRAMQFAGKAIEAKNTRMFNCIAGHIDNPRRFSEAFLWLLSGCGGGIAYNAAT